MLIINNWMSPLRWAEQCGGNVEIKAIVCNFKTQHLPVVGLLLYSLHFPLEWRDLFICLLLYELYYCFLYNVMIVTEGEKWFCSKLDEHSRELSAALPFLKDIQWLYSKYDFGEVKKKVADQPGVHSAVLKQVLSAWELMERTPNRAYHTDVAWDVFYKK